MKPCAPPGPEMPAALWRRFLARHPHWRAPVVAPCGGSAARRWLHHAAVAVVIAIPPAAGAGVVVHEWPSPAPPLAVVLPWSGPAPGAIAGPVGFVPPIASSTPAARAPVNVPEPSSGSILFGALGMLAVMLWRLPR